MYNLKGHLIVHYITQAATSSHQAHHPLPPTTTNYQKRLKPAKWSKAIHCYPHLNIYFQKGELVI